MHGPQWIALAVFIVTYTFIVTERLHRLKAAMLGISGVLLLQIIEQSRLFSFIDFNTIGLLLGMMLLVGIVRKTGLIQRVAITAVRVSRGNPWFALVLLSAITAVTSGLLDNVTTILLVGPLAFAVAEVFDVDPDPFVFAEIFSSNIGGTATLIGDPPNILIGSAAGLSFMDFVTNLGPVVVVCMGVMYGLLYLWYGKDLKPTEERRERAEAFHTPERRGDPRIAPRILLVLGLVLAAFLVHGFFGIEAATIALSGATLGLILCPVDVEEMVKEVDWVTILFFSSLFMLVGTLEHLGLIRMAAEAMIRVVGPNQGILSVLLVWGSGILSAIVDNVPYTAAVIPLVEHIGTLPGIHAEGLWWSLALGACLGGNATLVGASANLVMAGIAEKGGVRLTFQRYLRFGAPMMAATLGVATLYVLFRYV
ncbi:MAG: ArsB/NhaD family transporter [Synergistales bacterium]|nr:ArsB/NhaD family transporter [Synergistales bacterium]